jgi:hypothetical protein
MKKVKGLFFVITLSLFLSLTAKTTLAIEPDKNCPICPNDYHYNYGEKVCCLNGEAEAHKKECTTYKQATYVDCTAEQPTCLGGKGCIGTTPTPPWICGYAGTNNDACCKNAQRDDICYTGSVKWSGSACKCILPQNEPTPPYLPETGGNFEKINFNQLGKAIPDLKPLFRPGSDLGAIISAILPYLFIIAGLLLLFYLIAGGFQMMTSANDEKGLASAKGKITNALVGFLLLFISYWLVQIVEVILGIKIF